jgi:hypothetical protein
MTKVKQLQISEKSIKARIKEEVPVHMGLNVINLIIIYLGSMFVPVFIFMSYILMFFVPNFLEAQSFLSIFTEWRSLLNLLLMPLMIIGCFLLYLIFLGLFTRILWRRSEKKSPTKDGVIPRDIPSTTFKHYGMRSFMIKHPKNVFSKGMFPWLSNWFFNFVGTSKIGKGSTIEEQICADRYIEIGKNNYIGVNSALAAHAVEGIFGSINYFKIKTGDNVTTAGINLVGPGSVFNDNSYLLPLASATKHSILKGNNYYFGIPLRKIFKKKIMNYLDITMEDLKKSDELRQKQQANKENILKREKKKD